MGWEERIQTAAYTSPSGSRFEFIYENVSISSTKKTTEFTFPDKDGAYIQDNGIAGRRFPFTLFFSGDDHDTEADSFLSALEEKGAGRLEHPLYGDRVVVPTGEIGRRDDLTTESNQTAFSVVFSETIQDLTFPVSSISAADELTSSADDFQASAADQFASQIQVVNASEGVQLELIASESTAITGEYEEITESDSALNSAFKTLQSVYEEQVKEIINEASDTILQLVLLSRLPARIKTSIQNEIDTYKNTIDGIIGVIGSLDGTNNPINEYLLNNAIINAAIVGLCEAPLFADIKTRPEAVNAAQVILDLYDDIKAWQDSNISALEILDPPEQYCNMTTVISKSVSYIVNVSFDLPSERREVLTDERQSIEYLASVGLSVNQYDDFIQWNDLTGDEIELLPAGLEVVYYA